MRNIEGRNPVLEAIKAEVKIKKLLIQEGVKGKPIDELINLATTAKIPVEKVSKADLNEIANSTAHQGIIAHAEEYRYAEVDEIIEYAKSKGEAPLVVILDEIQDPHNLGSIIRTANVAGVHGVIIPKHRTSRITPVVSKSSAGAVEHTKLAMVTNLARTIDDLKEAGLWIVGTALGGEQIMYQVDLKGATGIVIGNEGQGMRRLIKEKCDFIVQIPMYGQINSLNASVAAGTIIYEAVRQRHHV